MDGTSFFELGAAELAQQAQDAWATKKQEMHAKGIPTSKVIGNKLYHEFPDGHLKLIKELDTTSFERESAPECD